MARALTPDDALGLVDLYEDYEWWEDRTVEDVRNALAETDVALGVEEDGTLVAAARVLTDYRYYANVFDVIVAAARRGEGVGERLLRAVVDHRALQDVDGLSLLCRRGLVPFLRVRRIRAVRRQRRRAGGREGGAGQDGPPVRRLIHEPVRTPSTTSPAGPRLGRRCYACTSVSSSK